MTKKGDLVIDGLTVSVPRPWQGTKIVLLLSLIWLALWASQPAPSAGTALQTVTVGHYFKASNTNPSQLFGAAIAISGNTMVIGAPLESSNATGVNGDQNNVNASQAGAAYVFVREAGVWSQQAYLKASNTEAGDDFGRAVAIDGDTIVIGATGEDSSATGVNGNQNNNDASFSGAAYVFVREEGVWSQQAYLKASNTEGGDYFGASVAVSGDTIAISATDERSNATGINGNQSDNSLSSAGAVYVFTRDGTNWSQQAYVKASNTDSFDYFGMTVALDGNTLAVGAPYEDSNATGVNGNQSNNDIPFAGAVYVFTRNITAWSQQAYIKASNTDGGPNNDSGEQFGGAIALHNDTLVVGATREDSSATGVNGNQNDNSMAVAGAAYVFIRNGTVWSQQAYLKASNTEAFDAFGRAVAIFDDKVVITASSEDSAATGIDGDESDNSALDAGAAYLFVREGTVWSHEAYIKASNTEQSDLFGAVTSIGLTSETLVVGAASEASNATGIDGNQANNNAEFAGAAYSFNVGAAVTRWVNQDGGDWTTAVNWDPAIVPGSTAETLFELNATYDVNVGTRQSGRSRIEAGSVLFDNADLTLTGPFSVGKAASFNLPEGEITANELLIGHLPPTNPANPETAQVTISNAGTVFTATAQTIIGQAGAGHLFVNGGRLAGSEGLIGVSSPGTAVVGGSTAEWNTNTLAVGVAQTATLTIETGGVVAVDDTLSIGQGSSLQSFPAVVEIDNRNTPAPPLGNLRVSNLFVGDGLPGMLAIRNGGVVAVFNLLHVGFQAHSGAVADGLIIVQGSDGPEQNASEIFVFGDGLLGMGDGAHADWNITNGGKAGISVGALHLGHVANSEGSLTISGFSAGGLLRSEMSVTNGGNQDKACRVGFEGEGLLKIMGGALLTCANMDVGTNAGSAGTVYLSGTRGNTPSTLQVQRSLCVGGWNFCGTTNDVPGTMTLQDDALLRTDILAVSPSGKLLGQGDVEADFAVLAGLVSPGLGLPLPVLGGDVAPRALAVVQPAALAISATVEMSDTTVIALDLHGLNAYDQLLINGTVEFKGELQLNFGEGFAPRTGDQFTFIQADSTTGSFDEVTITGLAEGFEYELTLSNGVATLTALNDGVATTQSSPRTVLLPLISRP